MPYQIRKVINKPCYRVTRKSNKSNKSNKITSNKITAKCTTMSKAKRQVRLLNAIRYNPNFRRRTTKTKK